MRVLGISGSLRRESHNTKLLLAAARLLPPGADLVAFERLKEIPPYDEDDEASDHEAVMALREAIELSDAVLIVTPEYNHSLPGHLKNALDWMSRPLATSPLRGKPAAVIGGSTGMFGAVWAQAEARKVLAAIGASVLDRELAVPAVDEQLSGDEPLLTERDLERTLTDLLAELTGLLPEPAAA
ncbi:MAG: NADPH-dependent FMN reductase [Solirubrobacteraceae bacterium]